MITMNVYFGLDIGSLELNMCVLYFRICRFSFSRAELHLSLSEDLIPSPDMCSVTALL